MVQISSKYQRVQHRSTRAEMIFPTPPNCLSYDNSTSVFLGGNCGIWPIILSTALLLLTCKTEPLSHQISHSDQQELAECSGALEPGLEPTFTFSLLEPSCHVVRKSNPNYRMLTGYTERNTRMRGHLAGAKLQLDAAVQGTPQESGRAARLKPANTQHHKKLHQPQNWEQCVHLQHQNPF